MIGFDGGWIARLLSQQHIEENLPGPLQHLLPVPHFVGEREEIEQALGAACLGLDAFFQPRPGRASRIGRFRINAFHLPVREHLHKILFLEFVGLSTLFNLTQEPSAVL